MNRMRLLMIVFLLGLVALPVAAQDAASCRPGWSQHGRNR